jgi:hypothetical protein
MTDNAGEASTNIDIITAITPRPICAARSRPGDLGSEREEEEDTCYTNDVLLKMLSRT